VLKPFFSSAKEGVAFARKRSIEQATLALLAQRDDGQVIPPY
jgi:hypothetical protein